MNRVLAASLLGVVLFSLGCRSSGVGDPCIPEREFNANYTASEKDFDIDINSSQCDTRVCLSHYFRGRVTCPYGNAAMGQAAIEGAKCKEVTGKRGLYKLVGTQDHDGEFCCPVLGDLNELPMDVKVSGQCKGRPDREAVYCSCRCGTAGGLDTGSLCECPDGFVCKEICSANAGGCKFLSPGKWGSYCVKSGELGAGYNENNPDTSLCLSPLTPPE